MKRFTIEDIRSWEPCYDPGKYLPEGWSGTSVDLLKLQDVPGADRLWCVLRIELVSERVMRLFAVWSYRQTIKFIDAPDPRSIACADMAERFANNECTKKDLEAAWSAASAARYAARYAAWSAAGYAAESAAWSAASAAESAAWSAAWSAASAARYSAWSAQIDKLIEMIEKENS